MSQYRALVLSSPGSRGETAFLHALKQVGFDAENLHVNDLIDLKLDQDQLCLKYKVLIIPGGNTYASVLGAGKALALKLQHGLGWNLNRFAERGGLVLGVGTGFQTLLQMKVFGDDYALRINEEAVYQEKWIKVMPTGTRCVWLKGLGLIELPLNQLDTEFVIDPFAYVEAKGRLERLGLGCLKDESGTKNIGLCDQTGRIFGMLPHPEFFLSWTSMEDWFMNPTRAAAPGQGLALFENAARYVEQL
jgi:phosphoribosylformylglycinamidine (FGAM) synthase-like amidotransferase family enzyme